MKAAVLRQLLLVDWDFVVDDGRLLAGFHWYPGTFVPSLPAALIEALTKPDDLVFDPYGGVGTTALTSIAQSRAVLTCDSNPIATLSSYTGSCLLALLSYDRALVDELFRIVREIVDGLSDPQPLLGLGARSTSFQKVDAVLTSIADVGAAEILCQIAKGPPQVAALKSWYERRTLEAILAVWRRLDQLSSGPFGKVVGLTMLSAVARQLSSQNRSWGHIADNVRPTEMLHKSVKRAAELWLRRTYTRLLSVVENAKLPSVRPYIRVRQTDWRNVTADTFGLLGSAQLLLTSPPYAGAIDYVLSQRLSLYLLGWSEQDVSNLAAREVGARRKRFHSDHVSEWATDLVVALDGQLALLSSTAFAVFVMPQKDFGRDLGEAELRKAMTSRGWNVVLSRDRSIRQARTRQSWTSIKQETILVFERS